MIKFLHIADIHLGCRRYNVDERTRDFFFAWRDVIERHAIPNNVDFVLICGDFFDRRNLDPQAMNHAIAGLGLLKAAGIPVLAIEGNHDQRDVVSDYSWMRSLSQWGYLNLLEPGSVAGTPGMMLEPWNPETRRGSYIDIAGARIFGSHWYGASSNTAIPMLAEAIKGARAADKFNVLMLHSDVEGQLGRPALPTLSMSTLLELRVQVQYVALGHTHKRFDLDNWAFNPGSLEACSIDEYREERGAFLVEVDDHGQVAAQLLRDYYQRPFQRLSFDVSGALDPAAVQLGVIELVQREARCYDESSAAPAPIIELSLKGQIGFKSSLLDMGKLRDEARRLTGALHIIMRNQTVPVEFAVAAGMDVQAPRHERERRIIEDLIARNNEFRDRAAQLAQVVIEAKRLALSNEAPEHIFDLLQSVLADSAAMDQPDLAAEPALSQHAVNAEPLPSAETTTLAEMH